MKQIKNLILLAFAFPLVMTGCDSSISGDFVENQPPSTNLTVDKINRGEEDRLSSQINISWWGVDSDGYIVGYEYAINDTSENAWTYTEKTDSTFILPISSGQSTDDVLFKVRAIDNDGATDPVGARLVYPIVNTAPTVEINSVETPPDTLFSIASFGWQINDPDGFLNIDRTEIAFNDTTDWISIPIPDNAEQNGLFISVELDNSVTGTTSGELFLGKSYIRTQIQAPNLEVGGDNTFYVRTVDKAGASSSVDTVSWYIKEQRSRTLFLNDFSGTFSGEAQALHLDLLDQNGIQPDVWIINDGQAGGGRKVRLSEAFPVNIDPTLKKTLAKWDHIYWISNDIDRNITYAQEILSDFIDEGGNLFVNIPMKGLDLSDPIFNFLPVDSLGVLTGIETGFQIPNNTEILSSPEFNGPNPLTTQRITGSYPLKPIVGAQSIYTADFKTSTLVGSTTEYDEFESVGIRNPEGNLVYFALDFRLITGNNNLSDLVNSICVGDLEFVQ
ncbi:hypothetical protein AB2B38_006115 [Balneola sp. MJW-20]|uniref:hypothetical protein n=1 Tax=Gracilimonas aurantiaca TaxID=3234185 RepID=UPI003467568F